MTLTTITGESTPSLTNCLSNVSISTDIDLESGSAVWTIFPHRFLPILGYYAIGIYKGAIDYDSINRQMMPENRETLRALKNAMETWDNNKQLNSLNFNDPSRVAQTYRTDTINRWED